MTKKNKNTLPFSHHKLEVYGLALEVARLARPIADAVPRGYRTYADHLLRSSGNTVLLIGEGANRYSAGNKRQRYEEALGEAGEVAVAAEVLDTLGLSDPAEVERLLGLSGRVCAMLTRLVQRFR